MEEEQGQTSVIETKVAETVREAEATSQTAVPTVDPAAERCPACPSGGAPIPPETDAEDSDNVLVWIACHKCSEWYHTYCVIASRIDVDASLTLRDTIPVKTRQEAESHKQGNWWDWSVGIDRWYCASCIAFSIDPANPRKPHHPLVATLKATPSSSKRRSAPTTLGSADGSNKRPKRQVTMAPIDYRALHNHDATPTSKWLNLIHNPGRSDREISDRPFTRIRGSQLTRAWIESPESNAVFFGPSREPFIIQPEDGGFTEMGGKIPGPDLTVTDIARLVGADRMVDVIDIGTQTSSQWTLEKWAQYVEDSATGESLENGKALGQPQGKVYNVISLEISGTDLAKKVRPPKIVRQIDWVDQFWDFGPRGKIEEADEDEPHGEVKAKPAVKWPKVQLYCLMGMRGSWTDWHIDFAASSVYYTIHTGAKTFFFIRPTPHNLAEYKRWSGSAECQQHEWLGDRCDEVRSVTLHAGDTMIIPSGYIHAVYTPKDSIVFGGNFLHSYDIDSQLKVREIEIDTKVPQRFRYPHFERLSWYVAERYTNELRDLRRYKPSKKVDAPCLIHARVLSGLSLLADFLIKQAAILENPAAEDKTRKLAWERIPSVKVPDPAALARELKWRVDKELGVENVLAKPADTASNVVQSLGNGQVEKAKQFAPLSRRPKSRTVDYSAEAWEVSNVPTRSSVEEIVLEKPAGDDASAREVPAEKATQTIKTETQSRRRVLTWGDKTVLQEQELVWKTTQTIWGGVKAEN